jgi:hypothetical protein
VRKGKWEFDNRREDLFENKNNKSNQGMKHRLFREMEVFCILL